jgi:signal transduction histidine kinase
VLLIHYFIIISTFILCLSILYITLNNKPKVKGKLFFIFLVISLLIWNVCSFIIFFVINNHIAALIIAKIIHISILFIPIFALKLYLSLIKLYKSKITFLFYLINFILFILIAFTDLIVLDVIPKNLIKNYVVPGYYYKFFIFSYLAEIFIAHFILIYKYKNCAFKTKLQIKYFLLAGITGVFIGSFGFLTAYFNFFIPEVGTLGIAIYVIIIGYAIIKHRLFDIEFVISRTIARLLTYALLGTIFLFVYRCFYIKINYSFLFVSIVLLIIISETFHYLLKQIQKLPDKFLLKNYYDYKEVFNLISESFDRCISINDLLVMLETQIRAYLDTSYVKIYIIENFQMAHSYGESYLRADYDAFADKTSEKILAKEFLKISQGLSDFIIFDDDDNKFLDIKNLVNKPDAAIFFPLKSLDNIVGFVILGPKDNSQNYTFNDLTLIELIKLQVDIILNRIEAYEIVRSNLSKAEKIASLIKLMNHYNHELKAPWAILLQTLDLPNTTMEKMSAVIEKQWFRSEKLINTMTRIIKDQHKRNEEQLNLNDIIESVERIYPIRGCGTVVREFDPDLPNIIGDKQDLQILFCNIFKNAMEACRKQSYTDGERDPDKFFITTKYDKKTKQITVEIKDQGVGIPKEKIANIWESGISTHEGGTGVGMGIIKRIIDEHGAQVVIESFEGVGTNIIIIFKN